ncbi:MAG: T9SS type A sorting domain-containing protein [Ignavibacteriaceae bacterium]
MAKLAVGSISTLEDVNPLVSVEDEELNIPLSFNIQNYPNPFNNSIIIFYELPYDEYITVNVFNAIGEKVAELVNDFQERGYYEIPFNADNLPSGVYIIILNSSTTMINSKMILLK